ncbi:MAG: hypothetical protein ACKO13_09390 [Cytophagales bacterium]
MLGIGCIETFIVSCNQVMRSSFLGKRLDMNVVAELQKLGVDACGENGEYHTLVVNMPLFRGRMPVVFGDVRQHGELLVYGNEIDECCTLGKFRVNVIASFV